MPVVQYSIETPGSFFCIVGPKMFEDMVRENVRWDYYHKRHRERWERRYNKPYPEVICSVGRFEGVRICR